MNDNIVLVSGMIFTGLILLGLALLFGKIVLRRIYRTIKWFFTNW